MATISATIRESNNACSRFIASEVYHYCLRPRAGIDSPFIRQVDHAMSGATATAAPRGDVEVEFDSVGDGQD